MPWIPIAAAGVGAAGSIAGSLIGKKGAKDAQDDLKDIAKLGLRRTDLWRKFGRKSAKNYMRMLREGPGEFDPEQDPGFEYGYKRYVENPRLRSASVRGRLFDPSTQKALGREASDYASTKYDNFLARYYDKLKPHWAMSEAGRTASLSGAGQAVSLGPAIAGAQYGQTNALMAGVAGVSNIANRALDYYGTQNILNQRNYQLPDHKYREAVR